MATRAYASELIRIAAFNGKFCDYGNSVFENNNKYSHLQQKRHPVPHLLIDLKSILDNYAKN